MAACWSYLERQIALLKPKIIVLLGKAAVHAVLHDDKTLGAMRGQRFEYAGIPVVVTYHPAYLLRNLLFARRLLGEQTTPECRSDRPGGRLKLILNISILADFSG